MKSYFFACLAAATLASTPTYAQRGERDHPHRPMRQAQAGMAKEQAIQERAADAPQANSGEAAMAGSRRGGRLSPEERRQLRRDIRNADRDIYRRNQQRP